MEKRKKEDMMQGETQEEEGRGGKKEVLCVCIARTHRRPAHALLVHTKQRQLQIFARVDV